MARNKKNKLRNNRGLGLIVVCALVLFGVGIGVYSLRKTLFVQSTQPKSGVVRTSSKAGYIASSTQNAAVGNTPLITNVGTPAWVKVPSTQKLDKFTDMSSGDLTIYRINNPEVLKTTVQLKSPLIKMATMVSEYPDSLIMNASAYQMGGTNEIAGLQINNGKLIKDWSPTSTSTQYAFIINKDGSCKIYDASTPAGTILQNGGEQSYDFGTALIRDGKVMPSDGSVNWEIHTFIANDAANNLYVILSATNAGYDAIMSGVQKFHLTNMLLLDSGGSSQLSVKGKVVFPSQDDRSVPDYIVMK
ncbi:MAG: phosphodiester glycosidase family protein [Streptococcaceae bacterium]|jgi:exopolysaccharide biosynthesis protein|nr:phosphodiester glycosidase family protein [Streptococcaceae bacterium]